jgi:hypothetical protein
MKNPPTYDDANLVLKIYDLRREETMRKARKWFVSQPAFQSREEFLKVCPTGSDENAWFRMVTSYWDMAASFIVTGVLNRELFYRANNFELLHVWERVRRMAPEMRDAVKNPMFWSHLEQVANDFVEFLSQHAPEYYTQMQANIARMTR